MRLCDVIGHVAGPRGLWLLSPSPPPLPPIQSCLLSELMLWAIIRIYPLPSLPPSLSFLLFPSFLLIYPSFSPFLSPLVNKLFLWMNKKEGKPIFFLRKWILCTFWWMLAYLAQGKNLRAEISLLFLARTHAEMLCVGGYIIILTEPRVTWMKNGPAQSRGRNGRARLPRVRLD